jgi:hypothetical protein
VATRYREILIYRCPRCAGKTVPAEAIVAKGVRGIVCARCLAPAPEGLKGWMVDVAWARYHDTEEPERGPKVQWWELVQYLGPSETSAEVVL